MSGLRSEGSRRETWSSGFIYSYIPAAGQLWLLQILPFQGSEWLVVTMFEVLGAVNLPHLFAFAFER